MGAARRFAAARQYRLETVLGAAVLAALRRYTSQSRLVLGLLRDDLRLLSVTVDDEAGFDSLVSRFELAARPRVAEGVRLPIVLRLDAPLPSARPAGADLAIDIHPAEGRLTAGFDPDRHEVTLVTALLRYAEKMLAKGAAEPQSPLWSLPVLDKNDLRDVLEAPNQTIRAVETATLIDLFDAAADRYADRPAISDARGGPALTYRELAEYAARLGRQLLTGPIRPEDKVAILVSRGDLRWAAACLAVLYAGAAWVPLDPGMPQQRVSVLLHRAGATAVVTDRRLRERVPPGPWRVVDVDNEAGHIAAHPAAAPERLLTPRNLAYCIFTSGTTGTPQGVLVEHAAVVNFVRSIQTLFRVTPDDRFLQYASPGFDVSVFEIFVPLLSGASLWVVSDEERLSVESLSKILERERITVAELPPAVMDLMNPSRFPDLAVASVGGEPFAGSLVTRWSSRCRVVNGYGTTETTIGLIYKECSGQMRSAPPIGRPIDNHRVYVLDDHMQPVPFGAVGELYLGGAGLARGYLRNPALTAVRFVPDPFSAAGERLFRTGDLVRFDASGDLLYLGRRDRQVKVRGQRVELGEIESTLTQHPDVCSAVADLIADGQGEPRRLAGYVVAEPGRRLDMPALRDYLARSLPGYMVPSWLTEVPAIPVTRSGKVDLRALAAAAPSGSAQGTPGTELTALQRQVYDACVAKVFPELPAVSDADFFEAGGTSLQMMRLVALVRRAFRTDVPMLAFLRKPTLATLVGLVQDELAKSAPEADLPRAPRDTDLPLSPGQFRLWFMDGLIANRAAYNLVEAYRLRGPLRPRWLRQALMELVKRHEVLHTRIQVRDGVPYQVVGQVQDLPWYEVDLTGAPQPEAAARDAVGRLFAEPFDLSAGRPIRAMLLRIDSDDYVFAIITHHIVSDGRSAEVLLTELSHLYAALGAAQPSPLPPLPLQYADFAWWQRERLRDEQIEEELAYWRERLAGAPAQAELPFDRPRPAVQGYRGATLTFDLPSEAVAAARELGRAAGATSFMTLSAAFTALLARYSRTQEIVIGTPVANRARDELYGLIGFLSNMLVLRIDCSDDPSFADLVGRVKHATLEGSAHSELPFERLVDELQPERDLCRHPIFQVTFQVYDAPGELLRLPEIAAGPFHIEDRTCRFDLSMAIESGSEGGLRGALNYNTELFERATAEHLIDHYCRLLVSVLRNPGCRISQVEILGQAERQDILRAATSTVTAPHQTIKELVERQAASVPGQVAVACGSAITTYAGLNDEANRLASVLNSLGAGPEEVVAVCAERGPALVAAILAIIKAGAAYLPIDPAYPLERARFMLEDSHVRITITQQSLADRLPPADEIIMLDDLPANAATPRAGNPQTTAGSKNIAYVMYTSGSTGQPKGVAVPHHAVTRLVLGLSHLEFSSADTFLMLAPAAFDASTFEIWTPLAHGARLAIYPPGPVDPRELGAVLLRERVTVLWLTAQFTNLVSDADPGLLAPLRLLVTGGEALSSTHIARLRSALPGLKVVNGYGPTETATFAATHPLGGGGTPDPVPIGRPIGDTRAYVLDRYLNLVPQNIFGELYIGGAGVGRGYLGRPGLTAERFVADPFGPPGGRLYRTGDVVRCLPCGELEFAGRTDDQIKLRGFRIEPGEILATLRAHPGVRDAYVMVRGEGVSAELVAYLVTKSDLSDDQLRAFLKERLPSYMVPTAFVHVDALPLSANGKVDRAALPEPRAEVSGRSRMEPRTNLEAAVVEVWEEVLSQQAVPADADFFLLGGNSLDATRVVSRLAARFGVEFPLTSMFLHPTVAETAQEISRLIAATARQAPERAGYLPLTPSQRQVWLLDRLQPGRATYNVALALRLRGHLDRNALRLALQDIITRHEVLRSRFVRGADGWPIQVAEPPEVFEVAEEDAPGGDTTAALAAAERDARRPFDLAVAPPIRARLTSLAPDDHLLALTAHHIALDGWSIEVLLSELQECYTAFRRSGLPGLVPVAARYRDEVTAQCASLDGPGLPEHLAYWRQHLAGLPPLNLPGDRPRPQRASGRGARHQSALLSDAESAQLTELCAAQGATAFTVLLAAFQVLLAQATGQRDIVLATPISMRERPGAERLIGFFANTLVIRTDLCQASRFSEVLARTRATMLAALSHRTVPFELVVDALNPRRDATRTPLFQILFSLQDERWRAISLPDLKTEVLDIHNATSKVDIDVIVVQYHDRSSVVFEYSTDIFDVDTIARLAENYRKILIGFLANPAACLADLIGE